MKEYTDYDFYKDTYKGNMSENEFHETVMDASYEVRKNIMDRDYAGYEEEVQLATCSVADILNKINKLKNQKNILMSETRVKSESVGNYSRTLETASVSDIDEQISNQNQKIKESIRKYLAFTGLLYRGG